MQSCFQAIYKKLFPNRARGTQVTIDGVNGCEFDLPASLHSVCKPNSFVDQNKREGMHDTFDM